MFYSHEILTSRQYGVATVWLVATTSDKSSTRRVTRKSIQGVDVQRACEKILEPGAPIALRLQGSLLYGVSRVHNQQCAYLAADAKKTRDQMQLFLGKFPGHQLDPEAGVARRENNLVEDDPAFDPSMPLPQYDLETLVVNQGITQKTSSQMSPQTSQLSDSQDFGKGFAIQLDIDHSSSPGFPMSPFGLEGLSSAQKPDDKPLSFLQDDDVFGTQDWGLVIDENGNIIEAAEPVVLDEEPQLPPLPLTLAESDVPIGGVLVEERPNFDAPDNVAMHQKPCPDQEPFPERREHIPWQDDERPAPQPPARRKRRLQKDDETQHSRKTLRDWITHYLEHCGGRSTNWVSATQARRNAMLLTFGLGIGNIGQGIGALGLVHPLGIEFSGDNLFMAITGFKIEKRHGRRRTLSEAMGDEQQRGRRVKPRLLENEEEQRQAGVMEEDGFINLNDPFADGALPEVGREAEHPMSDHFSSTLLPWNRGSSVVPGSSARATNAARKNRESSSPLGRRGDSQGITRYSDNAILGSFGSDGELGGGSEPMDSSFNGMQAPGRSPEDHRQGTEPTAEGTKAHNDLVYAQLDREGYNFARFVQAAVDRDGERRQDVDFAMDRKWLAFDDLFVPRSTLRLTAAQAFYHTLCLATRGKIYVDQDGVDQDGVDQDGVDQDGVDQDGVDQDGVGQKPFGAIWIGVRSVASGF